MPISNCIGIQYGGKHAWFAVGVELIETVHGSLRYRVIPAGSRVLQTDFVFVC